MPTVFQVYDENAPLTRSKSGASGTTKGGLGAGKDGTSKHGVLGTRRAVLGDMTNAKTGTRADGSSFGQGKKAKTSSQSARLETTASVGVTKSHQVVSKSVERESISVTETTVMSMLSPSTSFQKLALDCANQMSDMSPALSLEKKQPKMFDIDSEDLEDPLMVAEYVEDMHSNYKRLEEERAVPPNYIANQPDINEKMRAILIDWLVEVHLKFKLEAQVLYLTVSLIDRYLSRREIVRGKLQLIGVTALLIASKYEEIYPPDIRDLVYITDKAYNRQEILEMEEEMLNAMEFQVTVATPLFFLTRYLKAAMLGNQATHGESSPNDDEFMKHLAHYICERTLQEYKMLKYTPSTLAAAGVFLSRKILQKKVPWTPALAHHSHFSEESLIGCVNDMKEILNGIGITFSTQSLQAVKKKYSSAKYLQIANLLT